LTLAGSLLTSAFLASSFVGSLYIWKDALTRDRDEPEVIKRRLLSIFIVCLLAPWSLYIWRDDSLLAVGPPFLTWIGITTEGLGLALIFPLFLTMSLFIGPIYLLLCKETFQSLALHAVRDFYPERRLRTLRNIILAPFAEEFVFRACICSLLFSGGWSFTFTVLGSPLLFGIAHLHHLLGMVRAQGYSTKEAALAVGYQLCYTTLFGTYASFIFLRTGHLVAAFLCHAFCNVLGFPDLSWLRHEDQRHRFVVGFFYILGVVLFSNLLFPLTSPHLYNSWFFQPLSNSHS